MLVVLLAAVAGVAAAGLIMLGGAHGATGHAQAQFSASQSQLSSTQGQLSSTQGQLSAQQGSVVAGTWTGTDTNGWHGAVTFNANHSYTINGINGDGTVGNWSGTGSIVAPGTLLLVEPGNNNLGDIFYYTISGNTMTYTASFSTANYFNVTTTLTKS